MSSNHAAPTGFSLVELLTVLVIVGILASLAVPRFGQAIASIRARSALDQLTSQLYRARMLAITNGAPVHLVLERGPGGCTRTARIVLTTPLGPDVGAPVATFDLDELCLRHTGSSTLVFDGRGMLRPPARSFSVTYGSASDRVILSIAGRIRRTY